MVVVVTVKTVNMQRNTSTLGKALETMRYHLGAELAKPLSLQTEINNTVGTVGKIDDRARQGLVKGSIGVAETGETSRSAESLSEGITKGDADIFGGVVVIN
jgi:hypothetical protein